MLKYAKIINEETKQCDVGLGTNTQFYESIGMRQMEVDQAWNGNWYLRGHVPPQPAPTHDEQSEKRAAAYQAEVDPITCHIQRLEDEEQTPEIEQEIADLKQERSEKVEEIKERYPYPEE